jgi:uncharacterized membrane protein YdfJ with MMPL/SSD domain
MLVVVALAFLLLMVAFRSLIVPIQAAVLNLLSVGAAYGVVVAIFQWGWGSSLVRMITTAAAIMVVVFISFVLGPDPTVKMLAVGMAAAVLIEASVIRMVLVPAVMSLLGKNA